MNIVVLAGGLSPEREVSLTSGSLIANALMKNGHAVCLLDVYLGTEWTGDPLTLFRTEGEYHHSVSTTVPDLEALKAESGNGDALVGPNVLNVCRAADAVYLALHGGMGEDGRLQAYLDCNGIRYTGTGSLGAALSMDKEITKILLRAAGVATPDWIVVRPANGQDIKSRILTEIGLPCVVKPCSCGSSVGISMVETEEDLDTALAEGALWEDRLIVEKKIIGRELTVGMLGDRALPPIEIIPKEGFYDYKNKYQGGLTLELCPAPLRDDQTKAVQEVTVRAFHALHLDSLARLDYIMDECDVMWCLEANALPGMTPTSLLPQMAAEIGLDYPALCEEIIRLSFKK
jgi:D-alanine-D-alanine ligase